MKSDVDMKEFLDEYDAWVNQDKYKDFDLPKITPKWRQRLLENKKFGNKWAILLGPFYMMGLGDPMGLVLLFVHLFIAALLYAFVAVPAGGYAGLGAICAAYLLISFLFSGSTKKSYYESKKDFYKKMKDFDPDAVTHYLDISFVRLVLLSAISGSFYLWYWFYKNAKAIKTDQKNSKMHPIGTTVFEWFCSIEVFKPIARCAKLADYPIHLDATASAWLFFLFPLLFQGALALLILKLPEMPDMVYDFGVPVMYGILSACNLYPWQKAIHFYAQKNNLAQHKGVAVGEVVLTLLGIVSIIYYIISPDRQKMQEIELYRMGTLKNVSRGDFHCADEIRPDFICGCEVVLTPPVTDLKIRLEFKSSPEWVKQFKYHEGISVETDGKFATYTFE